MVSQTGIEFRNSHSILISLIRHRLYILRCAHCHSLIFRFIPFIVISASNIGQFIYNEVLTVLILFQITSLFPVSLYRYITYNYITMATTLQMYVT